jgi:ABC-type multidrug transport system fused ATPase/permease subunit
MLAMTKGIREIITYNRQEASIAKMARAINRSFKARIFTGFSVTVPSLIMESVGFSTIGGIVIYLLWQHVPMEEIVAAASILMLTAWRILPIVSRSLGYSVAIRLTKPMAMLCLDLLETFTKEDPEPRAIPDPDFKFRQNLALIDATFQYPDSEAKPIQNFNIRIEKGQNVGLIGPSGAGKTTLALLLSGLVAPVEGHFEIDGKVPNRQELAAYMLKMGYVPQTPLLMEGTLADNVAFSQWGQEYDRGKVLEACELAALDFVVRDPDKLDLKLSGTADRTLSGGEAQRVAIARALFADPEVIIFDEATSALDQANEGIIRNTIRRLKGQITTIVIAHRLSTVEDCDVVYWLEAGRIKKFGPPSEIIPLYKETFSADELNAVPAPAATPDATGATGPTGLPH